MLQCCKQRLFRCRADSKAFSFVAIIVLLLHTMIVPQYPYLLPWHRIGHVHNVIICQSMLIDKRKRDAPASWRSAACKRSCACCSSISRSPSFCCSRSFLYDSAATCSFSVSFSALTSCLYLSEFMYYVSKVVKQNPPAVLVLYRNNHLWVLVLHSTVLDFKFRNGRAPIQDLYSPLETTITFVPCVYNSELISMQARTGPGLRPR